HAANVRAFGLDARCCGSVLGECMRTGSRFQLMGWQIRDPLVASERSSGYPARMKDRRSMLRFERDRPTNYATVLQVLLGGVIVAALLAAIVQEVVLKSELGEISSERPTLGLQPGAADDYYDPEAVNP